VTLPENYPDEALPQCEVSILKGLTQDHAATLLELAQEEAESNTGLPSVFAICERLREWLVDHNQKGHDDVSMHAQMLRRKAEAEKKEHQQQVRFSVRVRVAYPLADNFGRRRDRVLEREREINTLERKTI
jgi:hypothetical protein